LISDSIRRPVAVSFDDPLTVVPFLEIVKGPAQLFHRAEGPYPEELLLEGPDESFGAAVPIGLPDVGRTRLDPKELDLLLEDIAHERAAVILTKLQATGEPRAVPPEVPRIPWRNGSSASKRVPFLAAWMPTQSALR